MGYSHGISSNLVFKMFAEGKTEQEVVSKTGLSKAHIRKRFSEYEVYNAKFNSSDNKNRLLQILGIEKELFRLINKYNKDEKVNNRISHLSYIYSIFNATQ